MEMSAGAFTRLCCGALFAASLFSVSFARADIVDDLLAGKSVDESRAVAEQDADDAPSDVSDHTDRVIISEESRALEGGAELHVKLPSLGIVEHSSETYSSAPGGPMSMVPEPSAIILASLALAYFFVFFRHRYA